MRVITNNIPRLVIDGYQLTPEERAEFDYVDWDAVDRGEESATFFRYLGHLYDLSEFSVDYGITRGAGLPDSLSTWDGYQSDSAFSATVVRYVDDGDRVIVGRVIT